MLVLSKTNMEEAKPISSPTVASCKLSISDALLQGLNWCLIICHYNSPWDQFFSKQHLSVYVQASWITQYAVKCILCYLKDNISWSLHLLPASPHSPLSLDAYYDADWALLLMNVSPPLVQVSFMSPFLVVKDVASSHLLQHWGWLQELSPCRCWNFLGPNSVVWLCISHSVPHHLCNII